MAAALLVPKETLEWMAGKAQEGNFMTYLFGDSDESEMLTAIQHVGEQFKEVFKAVSESSKLNFGFVKDDLDDIVSVIAWIISRIGDLMAISKGYATGGIEGGGYEIRRAMARSEIRDLVDQQADFEEQQTGKRISERERARRAKEEEDRWVENNPYTPSGGLMSTRFNSLDFINPMRSIDMIRDLGGRTSSFLGLTPDTPVPYGSSVPKPVLIDEIENAAPDSAALGASTPLGTGARDVNIRVSGNITVDGELGTVIDETNIRESVQQAVTEQFGLTMPQYPTVGR